MRIMQTIAFCDQIWQFNDKSEVVIRGHDVGD